MGDGTDEDAIQNTLIEQNQLKMTLKCNIIIPCIAQ